MTRPEAGWVRFVALRLVGAVVTLVALSGLIFTATEVLPGDAAAMIAGPGASAEQVAAIRADLGLDRGAVERYLDWITGSIRGDLGTAYLGGREVSAVLADRIPASALLVGLVYALAIPIGFALGAIAGFDAAGGKRRLDRLVSAGTFTAIGVPEFVLAGLLLSVLAAGLGLVPAVSLVPLGSSPLEVPQTLVMPVLTLTIPATAILARLVRSCFADVVGTPYVEAARLSGIGGWALVTRHVLPNAAAPVVQALAVSMAAMVGGTAVVESVFDYPGIGSTLRAAVAARDIPLVQGIALALCAITLSTLLIGDLLTRVISPAQRPGQASA